MGIAGVHTDDIIAVTVDATACHHTVDYLEGTALDHRNGLRLGFWKRVAHRLRRWIPNPLLCADANTRRARRELEAFVANDNHARVIVDNVINCLVHASASLGSVGDVKVRTDNLRHGLGLGLRFGFRLRLRGVAGRVIDCVPVAVGIAIA